jgi:hypothetical protein
MLATLVFALLQQPTHYSAPPAGDTIGYWQQRANYTVEAVLDERAQVLRATGRLVYVNNSPDTLREFYVHQHLNAFRPGSAWSADDEREGRVRFQNLPDPAHAYERFTATPTFDGVPVTPEYPGAPDSTVVRFALPRPLPPGDTLRVQFAWDARPSLLPRRQGRRGRSYDFAQWYPRVAVYDRGGWQPNALRPAGEFYGEFGDWDVTLLLRDDQVLGTTGVVVAGDPGWRGALRWGVVAAKPDAYAARATAESALVDGVVADSVVADSAAAEGIAANGGATDRVTTDRAAVDTAAPPPGFKRVRILARDVHHFGWSVSPDYRYEGAYYLRPDSVAQGRVPVWDSVAVHVLYRPGDEATWGSGQVVARTTTTLRWLEEIFGPYGYPQMTVLHRIEGGGTEFPMMQMNGSPSQGLNLHEGGHVYVHGIVANNEWRSGWMDEGLTSYQTAWAQGLTPQERALRPRPDRPVAPGYAGHGLTPRPEFAAEMQQTALELQGWAQPIGTRSDLFSEFAIYNSMIYSRAELMFGALRDAMGDEAFRRFLRLYYARWALRHVDEVAMRAAAEAAAGRELDWFFDQWVHDTGVTDYALRDVDVRRDGDGWVTSARVARQGDYRHPVPVGVQVDTGWVIVRGDPMADEQTLEVRTATEPRAVRLDPHGTSPDWYAPNDQDVLFRRLAPATSRIVFDWPFLEQSVGSRYVTAMSPLAWYGRPGGATLAGRVRSNYQGVYDRRELGLAVTTRLEPARNPALPSVAVPEPREWSRLQGWLSFENPMLPGRGRPLMGWSGGVWRLDGITLAELGRSWDRSRFLSTGDRVRHALTLTGTYPFDRAIADGRRWSGRSATDLTWRYDRVAPAARGSALRASLTAGVVTGGFEGAESDAYARGEVAWSLARSAREGRLQHRLRLFAGGALDAPRERGLYLSARTPTATFTNHLYRPEGSPLAIDDVPFIPLGGAGLRGFDPLAAARGLAAVNLEEGLRLHRFGPAARPLDLLATAFADVGVMLEEETGADGDRRTRGLADAGLGLALRGRIFDRPVSWRVDLPLYVSEPLLSVGERGRGEPSERIAVRWSFSAGDLW